MVGDGRIADGPIGDGIGDRDPEHLLAESGVSLCHDLVAAVPGWVVRQVERIVDAWDSSGPTADPGSVVGSPAGRGRIDRDAVRTDAREAGRSAAADVAVRLQVLLSADLDAQSTTPLEVVRGAVTYPTAVLRRAGVPPVVRDAFDEARFPDDDYGLTPASLGAVDASLTAPALAWGAAKAMAHRSRHGVPPV